MPRRDGDVITVLSSRMAVRFQQEKLHVYLYKVNGTVYFACFPIQLNFWPELVVITETTRPAPAISKK